MSAAYWAQWDSEELMSMHGVEPENWYDDYEKDCCEEDDLLDNHESCPRCIGGGCNYCLMVE